MADLIVPGGPRGDIETLYRQFDGGAYEAPTVALAPFDDVTGAALVIDTAHHEVHEGEMFNVEYLNPSVSNGANLDIRFVTGAKTAHFEFEVAAGGQCLGYLYEEATISGGTAVTAYNMNRTSDKTPVSTVTHTPTVTATGSVALIPGRLIPGGTKEATRVGGGVRTGVERILKPSTEYLIRINNNSGGTIAIGVVLEWYEEAVA